MSADTNKFVAFVKRNPIGVVCGLLSIALAAAIFLRWDLTAAAEQEATDKVAQNERITNNLRNATELDDQLALLIQDVKGIDGRLVQVSRGHPVYSRYFFDIETETGLAPGSIQASQTSGGKTVLAWSVTAVGTYPQLLNVLRRMENGTYFSRITSTVWNTMPPVDGQPNEKMQLRVNLELMGQP